MEVLDYFLYKKRLLIYLVLAFVLALPFVFLIGLREGLGVFILIFTELWFLRLTDDRSDYEKDRALRKKQLSRTKLQNLIILCASLYMTLNILFVGYYGFWALGLLILILVKERSALLPPLIGPASGVYYLSSFISFESMGWKEGLFLALIFGMSIGYAKVKRKKDDR